MQVLLPWAKERGLGSDLIALCKNNVVREAVLRSMAEEARVAGLRGFEQVQAIYLHPEVGGGRSSSQIPLLCEWEGVVGCMAFVRSRPYICTLRWVGG